MRDELVNLIRAQPFEPFDLVMSSGDRYTIRHPELAACGANRLLVIDPERGREFSLRYVHVTSVEAAKVTDLEWNPEQ